MFGEIFAPIPSAIRYDIYGNITNTELSQEDKVFSYNTLEYTPQNKLLYIRARYYDSSNGTFLSKDTYLGNIYKPSTTNRYAYCSGDPVNYMDLDGHRMVIYDDSHGGGVSFIPKPAPKPAPKPSTGGTNNKPIVIVYNDDKGIEQAYIPDPRQYYVIQYFLKNSKSLQGALDSINKELFNGQQLSIKQIVTFDTTNNKPSNYSVLSSATSQKVSKSTAQFIQNNIANIQYRNSLGELYCDKAQYLPIFGDVVEKFEKSFREEYNNLFPNTPQIYKEGKYYVSCGPTSAEIILKALTGSSYPSDSTTKYEDIIVNEAKGIHDDFTRLGFLSDEVNKYFNNFDFNYSWYLNRKIDETSFFNMIKSSTDNFYPVIIHSTLTNNSDFGYDSDGHYYVVYNAYTDDNGNMLFDISDPYSPNHPTYEDSQKLTGVSVDYIYKHSPDHRAIIPEQYNLQKGHYKN